MALSKTTYETAAESARDAAAAKHKQEATAASAAKHAVESTGDAAATAASESVAEATAAAETAAKAMAEVPEAVRDFAEKRIAEGQDTFTKLKAGTDEAVDMVEGTYSTASKGISSLGLKTLETVRVNTNAPLDHALALLNVKSLSEAVELNTAFVRKQTETLALQGKEFTELAQKVATAAVAPVKARLEKVFKSAA